MRKKCFIWFLSRLARRERGTTRTTRSLAQREFRLQTFASYPGPRGFHLRVFFTAKFCDANRFYYFCYRH